MDYEICKKLQDAGFPQEIKRGDFLNEFNLNFDNPTIKNLPYNPTLSELIEACGDGFHKLQIGPSMLGDRNIWYAYENEETGMLGDTPEEAVAKLWLSLNNKKNQSL